MAKQEKKHNKTMAEMVTDLGAKRAELVLGGGTAVGATIFSGGVDLVEGTASATIVSNGGYEFVAAGGIADGTVIDSGGFVYVASGGSISGATISGGTLDLASGAVVTSGALTVTFSSGGELILNDAVHFGGFVAGFSGTIDSMDLVDIPYVASGGSATTVNWTQLTSGGNGSGTLTVAEGGHIANITLLGQYVAGAGNFSLQNDGGGGTLVIDPPVAQPGATALTLVNPHHA